MEPTDDDCDWPSDEEEENKLPVSSTSVSDNWSACLLLDVTVAVEFMGAALD